MVGFRARRLADRNLRFRPGPRIIHLYCGETARRAAALSRHCRAGNSADCNVYTTFVTGSLVKFGESLSDYLFWFRDHTRGRFQRRFRKVLRVSPRQQSLQRTALTFTLWVVYLVGALAGEVSTLRWALLGMLAPLFILAIIVAYGAFRPLISAASNEW